MVMRDCGTHHVEITAATIATNAAADAIAPPGARIGSDRRRSLLICRRKAMCAANAKHHAIMPPNSEAPTMKRYADSGAQYSITMAIATPTVEASSARVGEPVAFTLANVAGA